MDSMVCCAADDSWEGFSIATLFLCTVPLSNTRLVASHHSGADGLGDCRPSVLGRGSSLWATCHLKLGCTLKNFSSGPSVLLNEDNLVLTPLIGETLSLNAITTVIPD